MSAINYKVSRKNLYVDKKIQGALIFRILIYWVYCLVTVALMLICWQILTSPPRLFYAYLNDLWFFFGPAAIASFILLPLVIVDMIRLSNHFVGPMLRMRRAMQALARGEEVDAIEFRVNDFWRDFADDFNDLRAHIMQLSAKVKSESENENLLGLGL